MNVRPGLDGRTTALGAPGVYTRFLSRAPGRAASPGGIPLFVGFVHENAGAVVARVRILTHPDDFPHVMGRAAGCLEAAVQGFFANGGRRCHVVGLSAAGDRGRSLREAFAAGGLLDDVYEPDLVCVPDLVTLADDGAPEIVFDLQQAVLDYCARMQDRFAILDSLPVATSADALHAQRVALQGMSGALYGPWIVTTPGELGEGVTLRSLPPCGHVAGVYARVEESSGLAKAPANEPLVDVVDVVGDLTANDVASLNDHGVNCLVVQRRRGVRIWGARTLSAPSSDWRYVNVRRLLLSFTRWVELALSDLVMEGHRPALWAQVRRRVEAYWERVYVRGGLRGASRDEAYFIKCDEETNPPDLWESGRLVCEVGIAAAVPAEFIIVHITHSADGTNVGPA